MYVGIRRIAKWVGRATPRRGGGRLGLAAGWGMGSFAVLGEDLLLAAILIATR